MSFYRQVVVALAACLSLASAPVAAEDWVSPGSEGRSYVAINMDGVPRTKVGPFTATVALIPSDWPSHNHAYRLMMVEYDCDEMTRRVLRTISYSALHDPRSEEIVSPRVERAGNHPAVASQLAIVCGQARDERPRYSYLGEFTRALGL
jgi:hypothetical protein